MKITLDAREFTDALTATVIEPKATIPVLGYSKLSANETGVHLVGTDLDLSSAHTLEAEVCEHGSVLLPHKKLLGLLKGETGSVEIQAENEPPKEAEEAADTEKKKAAAPAVAKVIVRINECEYNLESLPVSSFPQTPTGDAATPFAELAASRLKSLLVRTEFAICNKESRYTINGALFSKDAETFRVLTTDGHRLSNAWTPSSGAASGDVVVPRSAIVWLIRFLDERSPVVIQKEDSERGSYVHFACGRVRLSSRLAQNKFPNWQAVTPSAEDRSSRAKVAIPNALEVVKTLGRVGKVANESHRFSRWTVNGRLTVATSSDLGKAEATIPAQYRDGEKLIFGVRLDYVTDFLKLQPKGGAVSLAVKDAQSAVVFSPIGLEGESWDYIVMPMREP